MNSTVLPHCYFGTQRQGFAAAILMWPVYGDGTTVGNVKIALSEKVALVLHPHVDVPYSLVVA